MGGCGSCQGEQGIRSRKIFTDISSREKVWDAWEHSLQQQNPGPRSLHHIGYFPFRQIHSRAVTDTSVSPPAPSPLAVAGSGSGESAPLLEERAKPSSSPFYKWVNSGPLNSSQFLLWFRCVYFLNTSTNENHA